MDQGVRGLSRGLQVLAALNTLSFATVLELSELTGLSRAAIYRILHTLCEEGFAARAGRKEIFCATSQLAELANGINPEVLWAEFAWEAALALSQEIDWPVDVVTRQGSSMMIRYSTSDDCFRSLLHSAVGRSLAIPETASGRGVFTMLPQAEQNVVADHLIALGYQTVDITRLEAGFHQYGCGVIRRSEGNGRGTFSIALPILADTYPIVSMSIRCIESVIPLERAIDEYLARLRSATNQVARRMERNGRHARPVGSNIGVKTAVPLSRAGVADSGVN